MNAQEERRNALRYLWLRDQMEIHLNRRVPHCITLPPILAELPETLAAEDFIDAAIDAEIEEAFGGLYRLLDKALSQEPRPTACPATDDQVATAEVWPKQNRITPKPEREHD